MNSGCVPCNPSTNPVIPDAFHMRSSFLSKVSQKITCVPYAFHATVTQFVRITSTRVANCYHFDYRPLSLPFGHWPSSGGFPAGGMRSGCVPDQVRQGLALSDIKGWRPIQAAPPQQGQPRDCTHAVFIMRS